MSLTTVTPPQKCLQLVSDAVHDLMGQQDAMGGAATSETTDLAIPHEVYTLALDDIARLDLQRAKKTGWRYLVIGEDHAIAAAEVNLASGGSKMQFSHLNTGPFVEETVRAITQAESEDIVAKNDYVLRLLTIPALYIMALWLHGDKSDLLLPMPPTNERLTPNKLYPATEFLQLLVPAAQVRQMFDDTPQTSQAERVGPSRQRRAG